MKKSIILITIFSVFVFISVGCASSPEEPTNDNMYMDVSVEEAADLIASMPELVIIDVSPAYANGHLPNAINYPIGDGSLDEAIPMLDMDMSYLVYCHSDSASMDGAQMLIDAGFMNVYRLDGNYSAWVDAGFETVM